MATGEIAGSAAVLVDPRDTDAVAGAIGRMLADPALARDLRARGLVRARGFAWRVAAGLTAAGIGAPAEAA